MQSFIKTLPKMSILAFIGLPLVILGEFVLHLDATWLFVLCCIAILGLVTLIGKGTEEFALYVGPVWGGLMNATFGNVTELIIALFLLRAGAENYAVVRSSITGSILGNLLLVLGAAMVYGGLKYKKQTFSKTGASINTSMLFLALMTMMIPSIVAILPNLSPELDSSGLQELVHKASLTASVLLLLVYFLNLIFSLKTHSYELMPQELEHEEPEWKKSTALAVLLGATICVAFLSHVFEGTLASVGEAWGINEFFIGIFVVAVVGNAAEGAVAVWVARDNKMDLAFQIAMGSCLQVALMVAPLLVIASYIMGEPMDLAFHPLEIAFMFTGTMIAAFALNDGNSNWLEGVMFLIIYLFFGILFFNLPL